MLLFRLGKGAFSEVYLYKQIIEKKEEPKFVVYKNIKDKYFDYCKREIEILNLFKKHNNKFLIKYYGSFQRLEKNTCF